MDFDYTKGGKAKYVLFIHHNDFVVDRCYCNTLKTADGVMKNAKSKANPETVMHVLNRESGKFVKSWKFGES